MDEALTFSLDPAVFNANMLALERLGAREAAMLRNAAVPGGFELAATRDGGRSFRWPQDGGWQWLGRTSMPQIRGQALAESLQHGGANILLCGAGAGGEIRRLLEITACFQAIFVIEKQAWALASVLRLHDFSSALTAGRLLPFAGPDAWDACGRFLIEHDGYLPPERVLAWPWLDATGIAELQQRVSRLHRDVAVGRATRESVVGPAATDDAPQCREGGILLVANSADAERVAIMDAWTAALRPAGRRVSSYCPRDPAMIAPAIVQRTMRDFGPDICILLDCIPGALHFALPACTAMVLLTRAGPLPDDIAAPWPKNLWLGVATEALRRDAIDRDIPAERICIVPPAAASIVPDDRGDRVAVMGAAPDDSPEAAGLHLATHRRLWEAARELLSADLCMKVPNAAEWALQQAQRQSGLSIERAAVRDGLLQRIRDRLVPSRRHRHCLRAIGDFAALRAATGMPRMRIFPGLDGRMHLALLDAAMSGALCAVPASQWHDACGLAGVLTPGEHFVLFDSETALKTLLREWSAGSQRLAGIAAAACRHIKAAHTIAHRFDAIIKALSAAH